MLYISHRNSPNTTNLYFSSPYTAYAYRTRKVHKNFDQNIPGRHSTWDSNAYIEI